MRKATLLVSVSILSAPVFAQGATSAPAPAPVGVGARVRILAPALRRERFTGRIDSLEAGEMVLDTAGVRRRLGFETGPVLVESYRRVRIRTGAIEQIDVSAGRTTRSATIKGALIGGVVGAVLIGVGNAPEVNPKFSDFVKNAPLGAILGVTIGGGVGYALGGERWVPGQVPR